ARPPVAIRDGRVSEGTWGVSRPHLGRRSTGYRRGSRPVAMTVVIADSSPLNYLTLIGSVDVLRRLYGTVIVPQQVITELSDPSAPHEVRGWALHLPDWIDVRVAVVNDTTLLHLDPGEGA